SHQLVGRYAIAGDQTAIMRYANAKSPNPTQNTCQRAVWNHAKMFVARRTYKARVVTSLGSHHFRAWRSKARTRHNNAMLNRRRGSVNLYERRTVRSMLKL